MRLSVSVAEHGYICVIVFYVTKNVNNNVNMHLCVLERERERERERAKGCMIE